MNFLSQLINLATLAGKQVMRNRTRSILTIAGVSAGMFLFATVETMQASLRKATVTTAKDTTLVVYRENRYCPATSRLPEHYLDDIREVDGVTQVIPIQIMVNNCGTSLDVVVFRGVPTEALSSLSPNIEVLSGSMTDWKSRNDGALVGRNLARRRGLKIGDRFDAAGVNVVVSGIVATEESSQDENVAFVHLPFLQQASRVGLGVVTQFNVKVRDFSLLDSVASTIDQRFAKDSNPTDTRPEKAFFANTARELIELIRFSRWLGLAAVVAVMGLVANTILLTVRGKISEHAVLKTLGYPRWSIAWLVMAEGMLLSLGGGILGVGSAVAFLHHQSLTIGNEGLALAFIPPTSVLIIGLLVSLLLGLIACLYPAWQAGRNPITESLRTS
jgi:putative ABC transport system permease protein|tara:strand:- start:3182 stop:4345 length:1164 start_codon:yes stop_codon:yes gene_type:complete